MDNFWLQLKKPTLALAPMEGVTDTAYRLLCKQWGADVVYTEFMSSDALGHGAKTILRKLAFHPEEQPVVCQIFGKDPEMFTRAAKVIEEAGFAGLDINFGCPARKVVNHGSGAALLREPEYARTLVAAAVNAVKIPVSIKVRASIRKDPSDRSPDCPRSTALDLIQAIEGLPVAAVMVHGRTYEQGFNGDIDVAMVREVKKQFPGIVLANGGITTPDQAKEILVATSADGLGIARGSWGAPWIFRQIRQALNNESVSDISQQEITDTIRTHAKLLFETKGPHGLREFRKHFAKYIHGWPGAAELRAKAVRVETLDDVQRVLQDFERSSTDK